MNKKYGGIELWKLVAAGVVIGVGYYLYKRHEEAEPSEADHKTAKRGHR